MTRLPRTNDDATAAMPTRSVTPDGGVTLDESVIHDVLRNDRRRLVLERLRENEGGLGVGDLAEHIAAAESGQSPPPQNVRQSAYVSLHQTHLPKLDDLDIVDYDASAKEVSLARRADDVAVYMAVSPTCDSEWCGLYLALGALGLATLAGWWLGLPPLATLDAGLLGATFLLCVTLAAVYQTLTHREARWRRLRE